MATKTHKIGELITHLKFDEVQELGIRIWDLPPPPLKKGDSGENVSELQKALKKLHFLEQHAEGQFDEFTSRAMGKFQHLWGVHANDRYDKATRWALAQALDGKSPDDSSHRVPSREPPAPVPPEEHQKLREKIVANAMWGVHNEPRIHYEEVRPIPDLDHPHHLPLTTDCSGFATLCYKWAGAPDPNGLHFDGQGYTGTLLSHMKHIPQKHARPGDLVVFGGGTGHHVCVLLDSGEESNPWLASHGSESGPIRIRFSDEHEAQKSYGAGEVTWLSVIDDAPAKEPHEPEPQKPDHHKPDHHDSKDVTAVMKKLGKAAYDVAMQMGRYTSLGKCATGVSRAISDAMGLTVYGNGNQIDENLPKSHFHRFDGSLAEALKVPGIVLVWEHTSTTEGAKYGHTAITIGNGESSCSDFYEYNTLTAAESRTGLSMWKPVE